MPVKPAPAYPNKYPCCGVVAVAAMAGVPFATAWNLLGQDRAHNWKGRTVHSARIAALYDLGYNVNTVQLYGQWTLRAFVEKYAKHGRSYMVHVRGHVMVVRDDIVIDQEGAIPADLHRKRLARVQCFTVIKG